VGRHRRGIGGLGRIGHRIESAMSWSF
jgi:hypothetical protein